MVDAGWRPVGDGCRMETCWWQIQPGDLLVADALLREYAPPQDFRDTIAAKKTLLEDR